MMTTTVIIIATEERKVGHCKDNAKTITMEKL